MVMSTTNSVQTKAMRLVLSVGMVVMLLKFVAYFNTHSTAILSDALESIINIAAGAFALYSLYLASKPKDLDHPYGHGKIEFISAGFEGGLILIAGIIIIVKSINNIIHPTHLQALDVGAILTATAGLINFLLGRYLLKIGEQQKSITLIADGKHLLSDTWSSIGLVGGVVIIYFTGIQVLDSVFAIAFGFIIIYTGYQLLRKSLAGLMDEADAETLQKMVDVLNMYRNERWIDIHNLRVQQYGSSYHIDCHITLPWYEDLKTSHEELKRIENLIADEFHHQVELFIHPDPCLPESCRVCQLTSCTYRRHNFTHKVTWDLTNLLDNQKHS